MQLWDNKWYALSVFVGAFNVLPLHARCLSSRALFCLHMLALLQGEALGYGGYCCSAIVGFSQIDIIFSRRLCFLPITLLRLRFSCQ
jgi:hypothetical protein